MILHKMMIGAGQAASGRYWLLPGGRFFGLVDGELVAMEQADGWPRWTAMGDVFTDAQGRVGFNYMVNLGGGIGEIRNVRVKRDLAQHEAVMPLGRYQGFASERMALQIVDLGQGTNPYAFTRPNWYVERVGGFGFETAWTVDWPWEMQSNGHENTGESTAPDYIQTIQASYIRNMAYDQGVCAAKNLAVVLRRPMSGMPDDVPDPNGRAYVGWTLDAADVKRRVRDLSPAEAKAFAGAAGFRPTASVIIVDRDLSYGWQLLRPLGPLGDDAIAATGCLAYQESYERYPMAHEFPYYMGGIPAHQSGRYPVPLTDKPMITYALIGRNAGPVIIDESLYTWSFATMRIVNEGITDLTPTGRSVSRSCRVTLNQDGNVSVKSYRVFTDGNAYHVYWSGHPEMAKRFYRGEYGGVYHRVSPNGWRTRCMLPVRNEGGSQGAESDDEPLPFMPVALFPNEPRLGSSAPTKPAGWNDATQGPWTVPEYDVDESQFWKGQRYYDPSTGQIRYGSGPVNSFNDTLAIGNATGSSRYDPNGPYAKTAKGRWYGQGSFIVAQHLLPSGPIYTSHPVTHLAPGIVEPGYTLLPYAEPNGLNPAMRLFQWPRRNRTLMMLQDGTWWRGTNFAGWQQIEGLGAMRGTTSVVANVRAPDAPSS